MAACGATVWLGRWILSWALCPPPRTVPGSAEPHTPFPYASVCPLRSSRQPPSRGSRWERSRARGAAMLPRMLWGTAHSRGEMPCRAPVCSMSAANPCPFGGHQAQPGAPRRSPLPIPPTDPPARHGRGDVLPGGRRGPPAAQPQGPLPGAVREAVGQGAEHFLLLLGAAQALVVASLAHG